MKTTATEKRGDIIPIKVIQAIMDRGMQIDKGCNEHCRDFRIMVSDKHPDILILRWRTIDIGDIDRPIQCYRYECFEMDGTPQHCSIHYSDQQEANDFFSGLETLHTQECAIDHKL
jgi:hypothetical protein